MRRRRSESPPIRKHEIEPSETRKAERRTTEFLLRDYLNTGGDPRRSQNAALRHGPRLTQRSIDAGRTPRQVEEIVKEKVWGEKAKPKPPPRLHPDEAAWRSEHEDAQDYTHVDANGGVATYFVAQATLGPKPPAVNLQQMLNEFLQ